MALAEMNFVNRQDPAGCQQGISIAKMGDEHSGNSASPSLSRMASPHDFLGLPGAGNRGEADCVGSKTVGWQNFLKLRIRKMLHCGTAQDESLQRGQSNT
jgi:hypothetical protein